jgi:uncharacterized protein (TIGR04562 family)
VAEFKVVTGSSDFEWEILHAIVEGGSAIDLARVAFATREAAEDFLAAYGFDSRDEDGQREIAKILPLALTFLEEELLPIGQVTEIPSELPHDPVQLLLMASQVDHPLRDWACSLLRVCHVVAHGLYLPGRERVADAWGQVEVRMRSHISEADGVMYLGDIPIERLTFKTEKPWNSLLLKLLCKKDSVAEEIYDQVGCRIVTRTRSDTLRVVRYLHEKNVIVYANIKPSRSHNTLIDLADFRRFVNQAWTDMEMGRISPAEYEAHVAAYDGDPPATTEFAPWNRHTDQHYRSLQFTARILIVRRSPEGVVERFFFPFEVQIMDSVSHARNMVGKSNHAAYRERQRDDARKRVFPWLRGSGRVLPGRRDNASHGESTGTGEEPVP